MQNMSYFKGASRMELIICLIYNYYKIFKICYENCTNYAMISFRVAKAAVQFIMQKGVTKLSIFSYGPE